MDYPSTSLTVTLFLGIKFENSDIKTGMGFKHKVFKVPDFTRISSPVDLVVNPIN